MTQYCKLHAPCAIHNQDTPIDDCSDGERKGQRYFTCAPKKAFFCPLLYVRPLLQLPQSNALLILESVHVRDCVLCTGTEVIGAKEAGGKLQMETKSKIDRLELEKQQLQIQRQEGN